MTPDELKTEIRAIDDLYQRLGDHIEILTRRLYRHFDASPGSGKTDYRNLVIGPQELSILRKARDNEDDGSD